MGKKPKKKSTSRGYDFILNKVAFVLFLILAAYLVYTAVSTNMLTPLYTALLVLVVGIPVLVVGALSLPRSTPVRRAVGSVLAVLFCLVFAMGTWYIQVGMNALRSITAGGEETSTMTVYVRQNDTREMDALQYETFGVLSNHEENNQAALSQINQTYAYTPETQAYDSPTELVDALTEGDVDVILADQGQLSVLEDLEGYETVLSTLRQVETFSIALQAPAETETPEVKQEDSVFTVYISGSDSRDSDIMATGRSDVNIIATVNTETRQVLLLNTPRDFYVPLARADSYDLPDKLTHAGMFGVEESKDTLAKFYDIDIDYYFRVNFTGFEDIIDALDGIDIVSEQSFYSTIAPTTIYYKKGENHLNGYEALFYVRERYSFSNGDYQRGVNQMQVIEAVMKKAMSPSILTNYTSMMEAVSDCFKTSVPADLISSLVRSQLDNPSQDWNIVTYYVSGTGSSEYTYSIPSQKAYVTIPDEETVEVAKDLMQQVRDGKTITAPEQ